MNNFDLENIVHFSTDLSFKSRKDNAKINDRYGIDVHRISKDRSYFLDELIEPILKVQYLALEFMQKPQTGLLLQMPPNLQKHLYSEHDLRLDREDHEEVDLRITEIYEKAHHHALLIRTAMSRAVSGLKKFDLKLTDLRVSARAPENVLDDLSLFIDLIMTYQDKKNGNIDVRVSYVASDGGHIKYAIFVPKQSNFFHQAFLSNQVRPKDEKQEFDVSYQGVQVYCDSRQMKTDIFQGQATGLISNMWDIMKLDQLKAPQKKASGF